MKKNLRERIRGQERDTERRLREQAVGHEEAVAVAAQTAQTAQTQVELKCARLDAEKRDLEAEILELRRTCGEDLRSKLAAAEAQARETDQRALEAGKENKQWIERLSEKNKEKGAKLVETQKENSILRRKDQDRNSQMWALSIQLQQERLHSAAGNPNPEELKRALKSSQKENLAHSNTELQRKLKASDCELDMCLRELQRKDNEVKELRAAAAMGTSL